MKRFLIAAFVVLGAWAAFKQFRSAPRFASAEGALQVERLERGGAVVREEFQPRLAPYLALYHSAGWCPPCQAFSPRLSEFYHAANKTAGRFQLLMVDYDQSEGDMIGYMRQHKMEFPAVSRSQAGRWSAATGPAIPNLIVVDTATGRVVSSSYDGSAYVGCDRPLRVLLAIIAQGHP